MKIDKTDGTYYWGKSPISDKYEIVLITNTQHLYRIGATGKYDPREWKIIPEILRCPKELPEKVASSRAYDKED